jgi:hypothetical protein
VVRDVELDDCTERAGAAALARLIAVSTSASMGARSSVRIQRTRWKVSQPVVFTA